jgi:hypothetical protein
MRREYVGKWRYKINFSGELRTARNVEAMVRNLYVVNHLFSKSAPFSNQQRTVPCS